MEKRDLYDVNRNLTGEFIYKNDKIPTNKYILVVLVFIENSNGEFLIQKRAIQKNGKFATTGGHPKSGETSLEGMITEIYEELGLKINEDELQLVLSSREDYTQIFFDLYYMKKDININDLVLQKDEVDFVKWMTIDEIKHYISTNEFFDKNVDEFYQTLDYLGYKY